LIKQKNNQTRLSRGQWKTLFVTQGEKTSIQSNHLVITNQDTFVDKYPLAEIDVIFFENQQMLFTYPFLVHCLENHIHIVLMNDRHLVVGGLVPTICHHNAITKLTIQLNWSETRKNQLWQFIVKNKIANQIKVLKTVNGEIETRLEEKLKKVNEGDTQNIEGQAAKIYFKNLFGPNFKRFNNDVINISLNYGYALVHALIQRYLTILGYQTSIGIHHKSKQNPFNLSYDFIEPFRPIVDMHVATSDDISLFDKKYMRLLLDGVVKFDNQLLPLKQAIEIFILQGIKFLANEEKKLRNINL
jgi:CRISP-associated protein Cas1